MQMQTGSPNEGATSSLHSWAQAQAQPGLIVHTVAPLVWPIRPTTRGRPNCRRNFDSMLRHSNKTVHQRPAPSLSTSSIGALLPLHKKRSTFYGWLKYAGLLQLPSLWIAKRGVEEGRGRHAHFQLYPLALKLFKYLMKCIKIIYKNISCIFGRTLAKKERTEPKHAFHSSNFFYIYTYISYIYKSEGSENSALRKYFCQIFFVQFICKTAKRQIVHIC